MFDPFRGWKKIEIPTRPQGEGYTEHLHRELDRREAAARLAKNIEIERREAVRWLQFRAKCRAAKRATRGQE